MVRSDAKKRELRLLVFGWVLVLFVVCAVVWRDYDAFQLGAYQDDARYVLLSRSLVSAPQYSLATGAGRAKPTSYPFLFPLTLAAVSHLRPGDIDAGKIVSAVATLVSVSLLFWCWPQFVPGSSRRWGLAIAALFALSPLVLSHARMVMSDALFTALVLTALLLIDWCLAAQRPQRTWRFLVLGGAAACVVSCRLIGVALVAVVALRCARARPRLKPSAWIVLASGGLAVCLVPLVATSYSLRNFIPQQAIDGLRQPSAHNSDAADDVLPERLVRGLTAYGGGLLRRVVVPWGGGEAENRMAQRLGLGALPAVLAWCVTALTLVGAVLRRRGCRVSETVLLFECIYGLVLVVWAWRFDRFLIPLLPFLLFQFLLGCGWVAGAAVALFGGGAERRRAAGAVVTSLATVALLAASAARAMRPADNSRLCVHDFDIEARWLREHSAADAVVLARDAIPLHLRTGRRIVGAGLYEPAQLSEAIGRYAVDYLVVAPALEWQCTGEHRYDALTRDVLLPLAERLQHAGKAEVAFASDPPDPVIIYRLHR